MQQSWIRRVAVAALFSVALAGAIAAVPSADARSAPEPSEAAFADQWRKGLNGKHRQLFDSPQPGGGIALVHIMNYLNTYNRVYRVPDAKINAVGTFYGATTFHSLNDAMWTKYRIAEFLGGLGIDAGTGATANPWRAKPTILGMSLPDASIEALQARGARFIVCNNAMGIFAGMLAQARGLEADAVLADLKANVLPGVEIVPAMVIAIGQAHDAGLAYHRQ